MIMKKYFIPVVSLIVLAACGGKQGGQASDADGDTAVVAQQPDAAVCDARAEAARAVVQAAYQSYIHPSQQEEKEIEESDINLFGISYMYKYMTPQLLDQIVMANDRQIATDELFLDYDIWINANDWEDLAIGDVNIIECNDSTATAQVNFTNFGKPQQAYVVLQHDAQQDAWLICDFLDPDTRASFAQKIQEYLSTPYDEAQ